MKIIVKLILTFLIGLSFNLRAQVNNLNPDSNGDPWISGDATLLSPEKEALVPSMVLSQASILTQLPPSADNSQYIFMPPIFNQGQSYACVQVAETWYSFTWELNRLRNVAAGNGNNNKANLYHPFYTYNFLNQGDGTNGTGYTSGFDIIMENGCPSYDIYYDTALKKNDTKYKYWMHGYDKYYHGMGNTIAGYEFINWDSSFTSLEPLKHWIADHNADDTTGGLAIIIVYTGNLQNGQWDVSHTLPAGTPHAGEDLVTQWATTDSHALTIVGYNDSIVYDFIVDGQYLNEDIDGDGVVELSECERGAIKVANSWGVGWGNGGYIWVPYRLLVGGLSLQNKAYKCNVTNGYEPQLTIKSNITYPSRYELKFWLGYASSAFSGEQANFSEISFLDYTGGPYQMRGAYAGPLEIELDHSNYFDPALVGRVLLKVKETEKGPSSDGTIHSFSLVDHRWGEDFELSCTQTDVPIANNDTTTLAINYHLLPHHQDLVNQNLTLNSDRVSRFTTTVTNNAATGAPSTMTLSQGVNIDMYNSEIHVDAGNTFEIGNNCSITAKRGTCKLVIDGNISVGGNVNFIAEEGAVLEIHLNNNNQAITFNTTHFTGCRIYSAAQSLSFSTAVLTNCDAVHVSHGDITARYTEFYNTGLIINYLNNHNNFVTAVKYCSFFATESMPAIFMSRVENFLIQGNSMEGYLYGIEMFYCGNGQPDQQEISGNTITGSLLAGINAYNSSGAIDSLNNINNNNFGIGLFNNSNFGIPGNKLAKTLSQTQRISNNTSYEVYATNCSFPTSFHYNAIIDSSNNGNPSGPLIFYDRSSNLPYQFVDISLNCWGNSFNPTQYLIINNGEFDWTPSWCPGGGIPVIDAAEDMYLLAQSQADSGNYSQAKSTLQLLIEQYPESEYAQASMKELLRLEDYGSTDYDSLRDYFLTNSAISADSVLTKLGNFLANKCDIELERWQDAIAWYEQQILNPVSVEDSIFAIIDLEDLYLLLENLGLKSAFACSLPQYIPENEEKYTGYRDYLLSLFPFEKDQNKPDSDIAGKNRGFLNQNTPNPFSGATEIKYCIGRTARVDISISNLTGQEIACVHQGIQDKGPYTAAFINNQLPSGFYFYSLKLDGRVVSTRKMCVCR